MTRPPLTVLIATGSPVVARVLARIVGEMEGTEVLGEVHDGAVLVERTHELAPSVLLLDLDLPNLDRRRVMEWFGHRPETAVVVLAPAVAGEVGLSAVELLAQGAAEVVAKPVTPGGWVGLRPGLERALRAAAAIARRSPVPDPPRAGAHPAEVPTRISLVAVGGSTGAPGALRQFLLALGAPPPVPVLVVQHIAQGFDRALADWLAREVGADVRVAQGGEIAAPGRVRLAPANADLILAADRLRVGPRRIEAGSPVPSVDVLFGSCARVLGDGVGAVLLSGMGRDGAAGLLEVRKAGGLTVAQDPKSCTVYGMPRAAVECGAAQFVLPPGPAGELMRRAATSTRREP